MSRYWENDPPYWGFVWKSFFPERLIQTNRMEEITSTGPAEVSCCGRTLQAEGVKKPDDAHSIEIGEADDEYLVTVAHEMTKEHDISVIACVTWDSVLLVRLYPEQDAQIRVPRMRRGTRYYYCSRHGMYQK